MSELPKLPMGPIIGEIAALAKYNPHLWSGRELRAIFVARLRELEQAVAIIKATPPKSLPQHVLVTGQRGMGKTTLLHRVALAVEDDADTNSIWVPIRFPEELYTVSHLGEFWERVWGLLIDHLANLKQPTTALLANHC